MSVLTYVIIMGRFLSDWSSVEFVRFTAFSSLIVGICAFFCQIFMYMTSFNYKHLEHPVSGGMGIIAAFVMTIKQRLPEVHHDHEPPSSEIVCFLGRSSTVTSARALHARTPSCTFITFSAGASTLAKGALFHVPASATMLRSCSAA